MTRKLINRELRMATAATHTSLNLIFCFAIRNSRFLDKKKKCSALREEMFRKIEIIHPLNPRATHQLNTSLLIYC